MENRNTKNKSRMTARMIRRVLALVMSFAIVVSMGVAYSPDWFLKANDEGKAVSEPAVAEEEMQVEEQPQVEEEAPAEEQPQAEEEAPAEEQPQAEEPAEYVVETAPQQDSSSDEEVSSAGSAQEETFSEPAATEETQADTQSADSVSEDANAGDDGSSQPAVRIESDEKDGAEIELINEEAEEEEEAEEKQNASIVFFAGGSRVSAISVEKVTGSDPAQYWKDLTASVVGADDSQRYKMSWSSTDKSIAKPLTDKVDRQYCNDVKVAGYKLGTVTFTASANVNGETISSSITVSVRAGSSWTSSEKEMAWEVSPEGELRINSADGSARISFDSSSAPWSSYKDSIKTVVIDDGVTEIGENAFSGLKNLEQVTIGKGVTTISSGAFIDCKNLRDVTITDKESLEKIGYGAFRHCDLLTELDLSGCTNLKSIEGNPDNWMEGAFSYGGRNGTAERNLVKVDLTGCTNLEEIGDGAFYDRRYIDLDLSPLTNLVRIGKGALEDKHEFNRIDFSVFADLEEIDEFAFRNNTGVVTIDMSQAAVEAGNVNGGDGYALKTIGADAFANVRNFYQNLTTIDLSGCHQLETIGAGAFQWSGGTGDKTLESVNLSGTALKSLEANTFLNQTMLSSISIPAGMERIDDSAFKGCSGIRYIKWDATDYTRSVANTFKSVPEKDRAAMKIMIGKDVNTLPYDFFTSLNGATIEFEPGNDGISLRLAGDTEYRTYIVDENGKLYLKADDEDHDYENDEALSAGESWLDLGDKQTITYNGDEQVLVIPVIPEEGSLSYRFSTDGKDEWTELSEETSTIISAVDAGIYELYFRLSTIANGVLKEKTAMTRVEVAKMANPVKITVNGLSMNPNSPAHDFSADLKLSDDYDGSLSDFTIAYQVNGSTSGRVNGLKETFITRGRSGGNITNKGVYTPGAAGGVDIVIITISGKGSLEGNVEQAIYKVPVKVETDVHTITFTDGLGGMIDEITLKAGKPFNVPAEPKAEGLWFAGWNQEIPELMPEEDMTIEAVWEHVGLLTLTPKSAEYYYDGEEKKVEGFINMSAVYDDSVYTVSGISAEASGTEIGTYEVEVTGTPAVSDSEGSDVSGRFTVECEEASLKISEAPAAEEEAVIINYVDEEGEPVAEPVAAASHTGPIVSPEVENMVPDYNAVQVEGAVGKSVNVVYRHSDVADTNENEETVSGDAESGSTVRMASTERYVLGAVDENGELTEIANSDIPLADGELTAEEPAYSDGKTEGHFALVNLLLMLAAIVTAAYIIIRNRRQSIVAAVAAVLIAIISIVIFFMTEDLTAPMVMTDKMTVIMADTLLAELIALLYSRKIESEE